MNIDTADNVRKAGFENGIVVAVIAALLAFMLVLITWAITTDLMEKDAVANDAGHWTIVAGNAEFAWGPSDE